MTPPSVSASFDGNAVNVVSGTYKESQQFVGTEWDRWVSSAYQRAHKSFGLLLTAVVTCFENAQTVTWANSVANYLNGLAKSGAQSAFSISLGSSGAVHSLSANVYIQQVIVWYDEAMTIRYFQVSIRAA
jgi:hypothetical protein